MSERVCDIVITGAALAAPLGLDKETVWAKVSTGHSGLGPLSALEVPLPSGVLGGQAPDLPPAESDGLPREVAYLRHVIRGALGEAGGAGALPYEARRCGVVLGTTLHGMRQAGKFLRSGDTGELGGFAASDVLRMATDGLALEGWGGTVSSACSSGLGSIVLAAMLLCAGELDLVVAGGYDPISEYTYAGFNSLRLVAPDQPRPFCVGRQGMKVSEGFGLVVLERAADAQSRGAAPLACLAGWGESSDAFHLTKPHPEGQGAAEAMRQALARAGVAPEAVGLIAAHATGTPDNDGAEFAAMRRVFGAALQGVPVAAFKAALGHTLGAAGSVELILAMMAMRSGCLPASVNGQGGELEFPELRLIRDRPKVANIACTMTSSLGFGGANTAVVLKPVEHAGWHGQAHPLGRGDSPRANDYNQEGGHGSSATAKRARLTVPPHSIDSDLDACITGVGVVFPGLIGNEAFIARIDAAGRPTINADTGEIPDDDLAPWLTARRVRRMSQYAKLTLAATAIACRHAGLENTSLRGRACGALLGTAHGATGYCDTYYRQVVTEGVDAANPMLFAEGVCNAAAAHLSMMLEITGPCMAVIGSRTAGLDALRLAALRITTGEWDCALVGAADEYFSEVNRAYAHCGLYGGTALPQGVEGTPPRQPTGFMTGAGAVTLVLESRRAALRRGARLWGVVGNSASARVPRSGRAQPPTNAIDVTCDVVQRIGTPGAMVLSANGTRVTQVERAALERVGGEGVPVSVGAIYGHVAECFSVMALAGLAGVVLRGRLPALIGAADEGAAPRSQAAQGQEVPADWGVLCSDYAGGVTALGLRWPADATTM